jgi:hypothetical protein
MKSAQIPRKRSDDYFKRKQNFNMKEEEEEENKSANN